MWQHFVFIHILFVVLYCVKGDFFQTFWPCCPKLAYRAYSYSGYCPENALPWYICLLTYSLWTRAISICAKGKCDAEHAANNTLWNCIKNSKTWVYRHHISKTTPTYLHYVCSRKNTTFCLSWRPECHHIQTLWEKNYFSILRSCMYFLLK